jgi:hypothetical protein
MYYAATDNSIRSFYLKNFALGPTVPSNRMKGAATGAFRHLVYDPNTRLIYYCTTSNTFESINPVTLAVGPTVASNLLKGAAVGAGRPISFDNSVLPVDVTGPGVRVMGGNVIETGAAFLTVRGTAADANDVVAVNYRIGAGPLQRANGTRFWNFPITLTGNTTRVTVFATDRAGNRSATATITINRN